MYQFKRSSLLHLVFIFTTALGFSQTNFLQNSSFENWSGNPETPDSWSILNENSLSKSTIANNGNFSLQLDLNNQISTSNQTLITTAGVNVANLATSTTYTVSFDYKVTVGNTISGRLYILRDGGGYNIQHDDTSVFLNDDGNWHTFTYDFTTSATNTQYILELPFRARSAPSNIILLDNMQILGASVPDADNDGVPDTNDQCPNTSANALAVNDNGCEVTIDQSNILSDPSFEDWSLGGGANLGDWGILIQAGGWNKNTDINDNLQYSVEMTTSGSGSYFASIFQNDIQLYKDVPYEISIDYKVLEGTFNALELEFTEGSFANSVEKFTLTNFQTGWNTYTVMYTPTKNELLDFNIDVRSNGPQGRIILDNSSINATIGGLGSDADNDGVNDSNDNCINTPTGETVNQNGCSQSQLDDDNDGVFNNSDNCPNTPTGESVNTNGCSLSQLDDDNDGVFNNNDICANTPTGETVDINGCSQSQLDDDNDGVYNNNDNCANTPSGETVDINGCSQSQLDDDNDGVTNDNDNCPNTQSGESVNAEGCAANQSALPNIPIDGIQVKVTSTSCPDKENGEITLSFDQDYNYTVQIRANLLDNTYDNVSKTTGLVRSNLPADTYSLCVTISEFPSFEQCYTVVVDTPANFESGKTVVNQTKKEGKIVVSGSKNYELIINDRKLNFNFNDTASREITFPLTDGPNNIVTRTDKICQGEFSETVMMNSIRLYPNPTFDVVKVLGLKNDIAANVSILDTAGSLIKTYSEAITNESLEINIEDLPEGMYFIQIKSTEQNVQSKVVKQ